MTPYVDPALTWDLDHLRDVQLRRLKDTLARAYANVPHLSLIHI